MVLVRNVGLIIFLSILTTCSGTDDKLIISATNFDFPEPEQLLSYLDEMTENHPKDPSIMFQKAKAEYRMGLVEKAGKSITKSIQLGKNDQEVSLLYANILHKQGNNLKAAGLAEKLYNDGYKSVELNELLFRIYFAQENYRKASGHIKYCLERDPASARYFYLNSQCYLKMEDSVYAELYLKEALKRGYNDTQAYVDYIDLLSESDKTEEAMTFLQNAIEEFPQNDQIGLMYAKMLIRQGDYLNANNILHKFSDRGLNTPELWLALAESYKRAYKYDSTLFYANKALSIDPEHLDAYYLIAEINRIRGALSTSLSIYRKVLSFMPGDEVAQNEIEKINRYLAYLERESQQKQYDSSRSQIRNLPVPVRKNINDDP